MFGQAIQDNRRRDKVFQHSTISGFGGVSSRNLVMLQMPVSVTSPKNIAHLIAAQAACIELGYNLYKSVDLTVSEAIAAILAPRPGSLHFLKSKDTFLGEIVFPGQVDHHVPEFLSISLSVVSHRGCPLLEDSRWARFICRALYSKYGRTAKNISYFRIAAWALRLSSCQRWKALM